MHPKVPKDVVGQIRGENIYDRANVHTLHTSEKWLSLEGRIVTPGQEPLKVVKSRVSASSKEKRSIKQLGADDEDNSTENLDMVGLFGHWQTELFIPAPIVNGVIPKNKYDNIDLFKPSMLPDGAVHITEESIMSDDEKMRNNVGGRLPTLKKVVRGLNIDFSEAVTGFDFHGGFSVPKIEGVVVACEHEELVRSEYLKQLLEHLDKSRAKQEKIIGERWEKLTRKALNYVRLKKMFT